MSSKLSINTVKVAVTGEVASSVLVELDGAYSAHLRDVVLEATGACTVKLRDVKGDVILQKTFSTGDLFLSISDVDLFGLGGNLMIDVTAHETIKGSVSYWVENLGHPVVTN